MINEEGELTTITLGNRLDLGEVPQFTVKADIWFAARIKEEKGFCLVSCVVAPGFYFEDFVLSERKELVRTYPKIREVIEEFSM